MPEIKLTLDEGDAKTVAESLRATDVEWLAEQIEAQLPKAPVEEPTGVAAVIQDTEGRLYVRTSNGSNAAWAKGIPSIGGSRRYLKFDEISVTRVLSEGLTEDALLAATATPPAEAVEADERMGVSTMAGSDHPRTLADDLAFLLEERSGVDLSTVRFTYADDGEVRITARVGKASEPTPEQVEADLAQDEQAPARYYAQAASTPAEGDAAAAAEVAEKIAEAVEEEADELDLPVMAEWLDQRDWFKDKLHEVAAKAREIGGAS